MPKSAVWPTTCWRRCDDAPGIGLAAIQIGVPRQMLVIDVSKEGEDKQPLVFINPKVLTTSDERSVYEEGCLSIPDYYAEVERPATITVEYIDLEGKQLTAKADGLPGDLPAARDRSSERRAVHRPHFQVEARNGDPQVYQGRQDPRRQGDLTLH